LFASRIAPPLFGALAPWRHASVKKIRSLSAHFRVGPRAAKVTFGGEKAHCEWGGIVVWEAWLPPGCFPSRQVLPSARTAAPSARGERREHAV